MFRLYRIFSLLLLAATQTVVAARLSPEVSYYPGNFYERVEDGIEDRPLKDLVHEILNGIHKRNGDHDIIVSSCSGGECYQHTSLGYTEARRVLFGSLHLERHGSSYAIFDVYCEKLTTDADFKSRPPRPGEIPDPNVLNAEHTWPQSRFSSRFNNGLQKADLHILFPVLSSANSSRGNIEFGDVVSPISSPCLKSKRGYTAQGGRETYFEVPDAHKGNVARAIFYFSTRYKLAISPIEESSLRAWHRLDPVDEDERGRAEKIFAKQKVRNPFIDHPELVELISDF